MTNTVTDIAGLVEYHLVASAPDDDAAHSNLVQLVQQLELLAPQPLWREATWVFCDRCGCSVDTDLILKGPRTRCRRRVGVLAGPRSVGAADGKRLLQVTSSRK